MASEATFEWPKRNILFLRGYLRMITYPQQFEPWQKGLHTFSSLNELKDWYHVAKETGTHWLVPLEQVRRLTAEELERKWMRDMSFACLAADMIIYHAMKGSKFGL